MNREVLVIGGGPAGASLSTLLARSGRRVTLLEKVATAHDKVCGEFLSHEALSYFQALDIDLSSLGAVPINRVALVQREVVAESQLPFTALSLSRRKSDEALLARALATGVEVLRPCRVQQLVKADREWQAHLDSGQILTANTAFLATGKHDLHGWNRPPGKQNDLIAFKMHWRLTAEQTASLSGRVELILFHAGYGGLESVEDGIANLCLLVRRDRFRALGSKWENLLETVQSESTCLARRLVGAFPIWQRPLALSCIPYGLMYSQPDEIWRLGDQTAVVPSFAGEGMAIALHSAKLAASIYLSGGSAHVYQQELSTQVTRRVGLASLIARALVSSRAQNMIRHAVGCCPTLITSVARATRLPRTAYV